MAAFGVVEKSAGLDVRETYWIPAITQDKAKLRSLTEIDYLVRGFAPRKTTGDEKLLIEAIATGKRVLSATSVMARVKAGSFRMGNIENDAEGRGDEKPVGEVFLTYDFWLGKYPVSFWEFDCFCVATNRKRPEDSGGGRGPRPVVNVTWRYDAVIYCNWLSMREGMAQAYDEYGDLLDSEGARTEDIASVEGYRLPTEAEWEYAARGGHKRSNAYRYAGSDNLDEVGWYGRNSYTSGSDRIPHPVGQKKPNELGIYDMSGNVWEWCHDRQRKYLAEPQTNPIGSLRGSRRVARGGSARESDARCRVAQRDLFSPIYGRDILGFRVARTIR